MLILNWIKQIEFQNGGSLLNNWNISIFNMGLDGGQLYWFLVNKNFV